MTEHEHHPFDDVTEAVLRQRRSAKWALYSPDVLPAWVAEMDFPIAEPIQRALHAAIDVDDCGYADPAGLGDAFAPWAKARVGLGRRAGGRARRVRRRHGARGDPARRDGTWRRRRHRAAGLSSVRVDDRAARTRRRRGAARQQRRRDTRPISTPSSERMRAERARTCCARRTILPAWSIRSEALARIAELADRYGVLVLSDEIHAPLTLSGRDSSAFSAGVGGRGAPLDRAHVGVEDVEPRRAQGSGDGRVLRRVARGAREAAARHAVPRRSPRRARGARGVSRGRRVACERGRDHRSEPHALARAARRAHAARRLRASAGRAISRGSIARRSGWARIRRPPFSSEGKVALSSGPSFGTGGTGFARLNIATSRKLLEEAVRRMASVVT